MSTFNVTDARASLPEILDRVEAGEEVTLTRHGRPVAVMVRPDALRTRRAAHALAQSDQIIRAMADSTVQSAPSGSLTNERAEELVAAVRADRDRH